MKLFDNQLLLKWEETMKPNVPPAGPQRDQFLIRMVAALGIALTFQRAYSFIFGSQLRALNKVNSGSVAGGITLDAMRLIYDAAVAAEPLFYAGYSFEHWFRYLQSFDLIVITDDEMVLITLQGREFLKWLVEQGYDTSGKGY